MSGAGSCIAFVAGEASGDLIAAPVVAALGAMAPGWRSAGVAGERMIAAGCEPWHHVRELSVRGFVEVARDLPRLLLLRRALGSRILAQDCAALVGVDSPDFNLALEARVRAAGIATVHYVSPSIWAWRGNRIERIRRAADRVLLVFPFEQEIYDRAGIVATYVGHPLAGAIPVRPDRGAARARLAQAPGLEALAGSDAPVICLMPGSRPAEIEHIAPAFLGAARELKRRLPSARFLLPVADASLAPRLRRLREEAGGEAVALVDGRSHDCLEACDGALIASGTATLEAALYKRPMVIAYRVSAASAWIHRRIGGYLPWIGLPNILARESLVPELLQEQAAPAPLAQALLELLEDAARQRRLQERFAAMHEALLRDTARLAAQAIVQTIEERRGGRP